MSNETPADKKPRDQLTRIKVKHLYFPASEHMDLAFGSSSSQISNLACYQEVAGRQYFACDWIPAWHMFEVQLMSGDHKPSGEPQYIMPHQVKRWVRAMP